MSKFECDYCTESIDDSDMLEVDGCCLCSNCYNAQVVSCNECSEEFLLDNAVRSECGSCFCSDICYNEQYTDCYECGDELDQNDCSVIGDNSYCYDCRSGEIWNSISIRPHVRSTATNKLSTKGFSVGVEIECHNINMIDDYTEFNGVNETEKDYLFKTVGAKEDGSLYSETGVEFYTKPTNNNATFKAVETITRALKESGFNVDTDCGLHIHLGGSKITSAQNRHKILIAYAIYKDALFDYIHPSRKGESYCDSKRFLLIPEMFLKKARTDPKWYFRKFIGDTSSILNMYAYEKHGTLEVRSYEGTINRDEIINWIKLNVALFDFAIKCSYDELLNLTGSFNELKKKVLIAYDGLTNYYERRHRARYKCIRTETGRIVGKPKGMIRRVKNKMKKQTGRVLKQNNTKTVSSGYSEESFIRDFRESVITV